MKNTEYKIYKLVCRETDEVYYGKTIKPLHHRLSIHKAKTNRCLSKQIIDRGNYYIEQITSTLNKEESIKLERYYIENFDCINKIISGRSQKEWVDENREKTRQYHRDWYRREPFYCICGSIICKQNKAVHMKSKKHQNYFSSFSACSRLT